MSEHSGHHFGFEISEELYHACLRTLKDARDHADIGWVNRCAAENLIGLTDAGFRAYYEGPVNLVALSPMLRKTADTGVHAVHKGVQLVIRKIFVDRPREHLVFMADYMADMLCSGPGPTPRRYLCFPLDRSLFELAVTLLARVRTDPALDVYRQDIIQALERLIAEGVEWYYTRPVSQVTLGRFIRAASDLGIGTAHKGIIAVLHKLLGAMTHHDLQPLTAYFETLLHADVQSWRAAGST